MKKQIECYVSGRVQMVMYRDFAMRKASALGIVGTVRNLSDGRVHVIAEGEEEQLNRYIAKLERGSVLANVEQLALSWHEASGAFTKFSILYK